MATVSGILDVVMNFTRTVATDSGNPTKFSSLINKRFTTPFSSGTGNDQIDQPFGDIRTLSSTSETLDLENLTDNDGKVWDFAKIKVLVIKNTHASANLTVGDATSNPFDGPMAGTDPTVVIPPEGILVWTNPNAGWTVDSTHSDLKIDAGASTIIYEIYIFGTSA